MTRRFLALSTALMTSVPVLLAWLPTLAAEPAKPGEKSSEIKVLLVPPAALGEVRPVFEKRIAKALQDALAFSSRLELRTDSDRAAAPEADKKKAVQVRGSLTSRRIDEADQMRQEGTDLAADGKHGPALDRLRDAIAGYERSYLELVDYTKLADAYARAGLSAFHSGAGLGEAVRLFELGITLQPTLVVDRRKQPKELLDAFDAVHARFDKQPKLAITIEGAATGAEAFVDGVKVGPLPARKEGLIPGAHYVQVRGDGWQPWGQEVMLRGKDAKVTAKATAQKVTAPPPAEIELSVEMLDPCSRQGLYHADLCKGRAVKLAKQTGAEFLVFCAIRADRYGRLTLHPFVMDGKSGATVALRPLELAQDLGDLNARAALVEADVDAALRPFSAARALTKTPSAYAAPGR